MKIVYHTFFRLSSSFSNLPKKLKNVKYFAQHHPQKTNFLDFNAKL